jgi:cell division septation protein DedD
MTARGVATPTPAATTPANTQTGYVVQLGAYNNELYAKNRVSQLKQMGLSNVFYRAFQKPDGQYINRVYAGTFTSMAEAQQASKLIQGNFQIAGIVSALR